MASNALVPKPYLDIGADALTRLAGIHQGTIRKHKGGIGAKLGLNWPQVYCVLTKDYLYKYKNNYSTNHDAYFSLADFESVREYNDRDGYCFCIKHSNPNNGPLFFECDSDENRQKWIKKLKKGIDRAQDSAISVGSVASSASRTSTDSLLSNASSLGYVYTNRPSACNSVNDYHTIAEAADQTIHVQVSVRTNVPSDRPDRRHAGVWDQQDPPSRASTGLQSTSAPCMMSDDDGYLTVLGAGAGSSTMGVVPAPTLETTEATVDSDRPKGTDVLPNDTRGVVGKNAGYCRGRIAQNSGLMSPIQEAGPGDILQLHHVPDEPLYENTAGALQMHTLHIDDTVPKIRSATHTKVNQTESDSPSFSNTDSEEAIYELIENPNTIDIAGPEMKKEDKGKAD